MSRYLPLKDVVNCKSKHIASLNGHLEIVKFFITELNCDPNIQTAEYPGVMYTVLVVYMFRTDTQLSLIHI